MLGSSEEEKTPRRAARQRARRGSVSTAERATRKTVRRKPSAGTEEKETAPRKDEVEKKVESVPENKKEDNRKAPTPFSQKKASSIKLRKRNIIIASVMIIGLGSSAAVGLTDSGQINVNQTIEERNERIRNNSANTDDTSSSVVEIPVQNTNNSLPNGGLVGSGAPVPRPPATPPVDEVASSTATSTELTATSTDNLSNPEENVEVNEEQEESINENDADGEEAPAPANQDPI